MKICITVGHSILKSGMCTSAKGVCSEYKYCKKLAKQVVSALAKKGHDVTLVKCPEYRFKTSVDEKPYKLGRVNGKGYDLVVELHLNASASKMPSGTECIYKSDAGKKYATAINKGLATLLKSRGVKKDTRGLYMLNGTDCPAVICEVFFCTSPFDYNICKGLSGRKKVAKAIAKYM